jgi:hypothetical protein
VYRLPVFPLAPMSRAIRWLTIGLFAVPVLFLVLAIRGELPVLAFGAVLALYAAVYLFCRPSRFEVSARGLDVVFPAWIRRVPGQTIAGARELTLEDFRRELGWGVRIGVGGLWGGFGWLWTRQGLVEFYVSRTDGFVLVERNAGRPLLITPERATEMVDTLRRYRPVRSSQGAPARRGPAP